MDIAQAAAGYEGTAAARADKQAIIWSRAKLEEFWCFTEAGLDELRHGGSPTITQGPHAGEGIALEHVLPRSIMPELAGTFFNLEAITAKANRSKSAKITAREVELARRWNRERLLLVTPARPAPTAPFPATAKRRRRRARKILVDRPRLFSISTIPKRFILTD
jgi:hypothetical protein